MLKLTRVRIILIPLKLLQAEQNTIINWIFNKKAIILNGENNHIDVQLEIATNNYIHVFTSSEIILLKQFKKNIFDDAYFTNKLCLLAIDRTHLVE